MGAGWGGQRGGMENTRCGGPGTVHTAESSALPLKGITGYTFTKYIYKYIFFSFLKSF